MEIRGNLDIHELVQIRGGNPNNEYILTSTDAEGNSLWRQHWFLTQAQWDEWENTYNESEATQNKQITNLTNIVNELDDNYIVSGEVLVGSQELIFTDKNGGKINVTNAAALFTDTDTYVISGVYDSQKGEVTFTTNIDTTFTVTGFAKELTDSYTTSATLNGNILSFNNNVKGDNFYSVDLSSLQSKDNDWAVNGNDMYTIPSGKVGIGTTTPSNKLHVQGSVKVTSDMWLGGKIQFPPVDNTQPIVTGLNDTNTKHTAIYMEMDGDDSYLEYGHVDAGYTYTQFRIVDNSTGDRFRIYVDDWQGQSNDRIPLDVRGDRVLLSQDGGNVGIGTTNPTEKLHVEGNIRANSFYSYNITSDEDIRILNPDGGSYSTTNSSVNASILIELPQAYTNTMLNFKVKIFNYVDDKHITLNIAGYTYLGDGTNSKWYRTSAWVEGSPKDEHNHKVRFGYDRQNDKCVVFIGEEDSFWSYPKVYVTDVQVSHNSSTPNKWINGWSISFIDDWSTLQLSDNSGDLRYKIDNTKQNTQVNNWIRNNDNSIKYESGNVNVLGGYSLTINDYTFPTNDGLTNQILVTDGNGVVSWGNVSDLGGGGDEAPDKYLLSGTLVDSANDRCNTKLLELTMSDNSKINIDVSDISRDNYVSSLLFDSSTNLLTLVHSTADGCGEAPQQTVNLGSLKAGDTLGDSDWTVVNNDMFSNPSGKVGVGINTPQTKLHVKDNNAILTLETISSAGGNFIDYTDSAGTKAKVGFVSDKVEDFYIWNTETNGAINLINSPGTMALQAKDGQVAIGGIGPLASHSLSVEGTTHLMETNRNDVLTITTNDGILTVGGVNGVGNKTNNVILQHRPQTGGDNSSSSWQTKAANTNDYPEGQIAIELTTYFTNNGENIDYNALTMNSGVNPVNIIGATNDDDTAILSLQSDSKIAFQSHSISWPSGTKETMTIDIANDKVGINQSSPDVDLHINGQIKIVDGTQGNNKVLTSDANGLASWKTPSSGGGSNMPVGSIIQFAGDTAPDGWLMCDGTYHSQDVYRDLYQVISNTYDKDSQSGKFAVPDIRGRVPVGKHSTGTFNSLNKKGGVESVKLDKIHVPFLEHTHTFSDTNSGDSSHYHPISWVENSDSLKSGNELAERAQNVLATKELSHLACELNYTITGNHGYSNHEISTDHPNGDRATTNQVKNPINYDTTQGRHTHTLSDGSDTAVGGGTDATSHTNVQPYIVLNYIIYYGSKNELATPEEFDGELTSRG